MRLLLVGALGPYPDRVQSFLRDGHALWFVSTELLPPDPEGLEGIPSHSARDAAWSGGDPVEAILRLIDEERIDLVYSLLNVWDESNWLTASLLRRGCPVPVVRHYKEHYVAPYEEERVCIECSTGVLFLNPESREYFRGIYRVPERTDCMDSDVIPRRYLDATLRPKFSASDGRPHLLIAGSATIDGGRYDYRELIRELIGRGAHVHLYGLFRCLTSDGRLASSNDVETEYRAAFPADFLHVHAPVRPERFVEEWSPYDAGFLHVPREDDRFSRYNVPNRYSGYLAAGVPVALPAGEMPAMERQLGELGSAIVFRDVRELVERLPDEDAASAVLDAREKSTFEAIYKRLVGFLETCADRRAR